MRGLEKRFGGLRVTAAVDLSVEPGERRLIIGPNGAGKTTLFNLITGELAPDRGTVTLFDRDITRMASRRRVHLGIARTYQIITLFGGETLLRNITLSLPARARRSGGWASSISPSGRWRRPPTASAAAWRSRWRWRRSRACSCWTSHSPGCRSRSAATCCG